MSKFINTITGKEEGEIIPQKRAKKMIEELYWKKFKEKYNAPNTTHKEKVEIMAEIVSINFSKEIIKEIIDKPKCEGIRFYLAKRDDRINDTTLVLVGYGETGRDLTSTCIEGSIILDSYISDTISGNRTPIVEVGGGKRLGDYWDGTTLIGNNSKNNTEYDKEMEKYFTTLMSTP